MSFPSCRGSVNSLRFAIMTVKKYLARGIALHFIQLLLFFSTANSQETDLNFINFNNKDGLSSSSVNDIIKDSYGYLWIATDDGLNKFDGANFKIYRHDDMDSTSVGGNNIMAFFEDQDKNLWIGNNTTLSLYDRKRDAFINYKSIVDGTIRGISADQLGNLWVGGYFGLVSFNPRTGKSNLFRKNPGRSDQILSNTVLCVFKDSRQRLWIGTNAGLNRYIPGTASFIKYTHSDTIQNSIADNVVRVISEDQDGNIWFGTNNGLSRLQNNGEDFINYKYGSADPYTLSSSRIYSIRPDNNGKLWIGTEEGLNIFDINSGRVQRIKSDQRNKYDLVGKSVRSIYIDGSGIYWVGTFHGGVNKYDKNLAFFNLRESNPLDPNGLSSSFVTSFVEDENGDVYVGTDGGGLNLYHRNTGLFEHPKITADPVDNTLSILAMEKVDDELWLGTYQKGLFVLNLKNGKRTQYLKTGKPGAIRSNEVFCIKKDRNGFVWIGTNGAGVDVYDPKTGKFFCPVQNPGNGREVGFIQNGFIRTFEEDQEGNMWIGSTGGGIAIYDPSKKSFKVLNAENNGLPTNSIFSIYRDKLNYMWVGTQGSGLSIFDPKTQQFTTYSGHEGLANAVIYKILEDNAGQIWVSTNRGLSSFNRSTRLFRNYFYQNGLQRSAFNLGSGLKTTGGEMFFGGLNGFNYFNPLTLHSNKNLPLLQLTSLKIANKTVIPGEDGSINEPVSVAKEIRLDYKQNFSIDFIALNYTTPQETRYAYKLEGFDKDWNLVKNNPTANYTNLDPGNYVFHVKAMSEDGSWSTPEKTIMVTVKPPFWRTGYAYAAYGLIAILIVVIIRYQAIRKVKRRYAIEQERQEVKQLIDQERKESERQHKFDQLKIRFLTNLSHEFRTPISLIVGPVEKLLKKEESRGNRNELLMVKRNANRLLNLVNQLLDLRKIEETELNLNLASGDIVSFAKEIADSFKTISEEKNIDFSFTSQLQKCQMYFDFHKIERVLLNLLSNAFKFTDRNGRIKMEIEKETDSRVKIILSDNGIGMTGQTQFKIFDRFFQEDQSSAVLNSGSGIGLSIAQEFARLHGGEITVDSTLNKGSCFTLLLPYKAAPDPDINPEGEQPLNLSLPGQQANIKKERLHQDITVLLIEDNDEFRDYLKHSLSPYYKIVEACDGKEGWQKVLSVHPHVVVSDITMPHMDGITLCRKIRKDRRTSHIPVILLTAIGGDANQLKGLETGANDYLTKPFNFDLLNVKIKNLITLNQTFKDTYRRQIKVTPSDQVIGESEDRKLLGRINEYIENNIDSPDLSVEDVSRHLFMSRGSLYGKMLELTGEKPVEFIRTIRLNKAAMLLEKSDMKIAQIGYAVGFSSPNHFARAFKSKFNISPSEYMIQKRSMGNSGTVPTKSA